MAASNYYPSIGAEMSDLRQAMKHESTRKLNQSTNIIIHRSLLTGYNLILCVRTRVSSHFTKKTSPAL